MIKPNKSGEAPLAGIRVLDASRVLAGPFCGQLLGDLGAEVLKLERPGTGDETREWGPPFHDGLSAYFLALNRNKKSVTLDLQKQEGRELFYRLVAKHDVILENFRAESTRKLGLTPQQILAASPRSIVCSISGYGRTGPMSAMPGYDFAIQALSGLMSITGPEAGPPTKTGVAITDVLAGLYASTSILACLRARERSGHGYIVDIALMDCAVAAQVNLLQAFLIEGKVPARQGNAHLQIVPYQVFATSDDWLVLAIGNDGQWSRFCDVAGISELARDPRFATNARRVENRRELIPILEGRLRARTTREWQKVLSQAGLPHSPIADYSELMKLPQGSDRGWRVTVHDPKGNPVPLIGSPFHIEDVTLPSPTLPPPLGAHTRSVLKDLLQLSEEDISSLHRGGVI